jgi:hypothetical protein
VTDPYRDTDSGGIPRWAKLMGIIVAILVVMVIIMMLLPGGHGPSRHL